MSAKLPLTQAVPEIQRKLRITPQEMADELGVNVNAVWRWQHGQTQPQYRTIRPLQAMARRAGIEITVESLTRQPRRRPRGGTA